MNWIWFTGYKYRMLGRLSASWPSTCLACCFGAAGTAKKELCALYLGLANPLVDLSPPVIKRKKSRKGFDQATIFYLAIGSGFCMGFALIGYESMHILPWSFFYFLSYLYCTTTLSTSSILFCLLEGRWCIIWTVVWPLYPLHQKREQQQMTLTPLHQKREQEMATNTCDKFALTKPWLAPHDKMAGTSIWLLFYSPPDAFSWCRLIIFWKEFGICILLNGTWIIRN